MATHFMPDIETLGNRPGSAIAALGAVRFGQGKIISRFYMRVSIQSCLRVGLTMDASTIFWWLQQSEEARRELCKSDEESGASDCSQLAVVLTNFTEWLNTEEPSERERTIWGNGSDFDCVNLVSAYRACGWEEAPWKFWNHRCYRTVKNMYPEIKMQRKGTHHNALDDAESQAAHLMQMLPNL